MASSLGDLRMSGENRQNVADIETGIPKPSGGNFIGFFSSARV